MREFESYDYIGSKLDIASTSKAFALPRSGHIQAAILPYNAACDRLCATATS